MTRSLLQKQQAVNHAALSATFSAWMLRRDDDADAAREGGGAGCTQVCGHASRRAIVLPWLLGDVPRTADTAATDPFDVSFSSLDFTGSDRSISVSLHGRSDSVCSRRIETHEIERQGGFARPAEGLRTFQDCSAPSDSKLRFVEAICRSCETFREDQRVHAGGVPIGLSGLWPHASIQDLVMRCIDERERLETQNARLIDEMSTRWDAKTVEDRGLMFRNALDFLPGVARCIEEIDGRSPGAFDVSFCQPLEDVLRPYRDYFAAAIASAMEGFMLSMFAYARDGQRQSQSQSRWVCPVTLLAIEKIILCPSTARRLRIVQAIIDALRADSVERMRDVIRRNRTDLVLLFRHRRFDSSSSSKSYLDIAHTVSQWDRIPCTLFHQFAFTLDWQRGDWVDGGSTMGGGVNISWCRPSDIRAVRLRSVEYGKAIEFELFVPAAFLEFTLATSVAFAHLDGCDRKVGFDDVAIGQTEQGVAFGETHFRYSVTLRAQTARPDGTCAPSRVSRLRHIEGTEIHVFELSVVTLESRVGSLGKMGHVKTKTPLGKFAFPS